MKDSKGKCALITGGSSGIGYELAKLFAKDGYELILVSRTESELQRVASELSSTNNIQVTTIAKDHFDIDAPQEI